MPSSLSTPKHEIKKKNCLPFTCQLFGLAKATGRLCVTDPRKRVFGKTDIVIDFLLRDPPKPERKASLTTGKAVSGFSFLIKRRMNWELKNTLSLDFKYKFFHLYLYLIKLKQSSSGFNKEVFSGFLQISRNAYMLKFFYFFFKLFIPLPMLVFLGM